MNDILKIIFVVFYLHKCNLMFNKKHIGFILFTEYSNFFLAHTIKLQVCNHALIAHLVEVYLFPFSDKLYMMFIITLYIELKFKKKMITNLIIY